MHSGSGGGAGGVAVFEAYKRASMAEQLCAH